MISKKRFTLGENINNMSGNTIEIIKDLSKHLFFTKSISISKKRYEIYSLVARIIYYVIYGAKNADTKKIISFLSEYKEFNINSKEYKRIINNLNYLLNCFPNIDYYSIDGITGKKYYLLNSQTWVLATYMFVDDLLLNYAIDNKEKEIKKSIKFFYTVVNNEQLRNTNIDYKNYYISIKNGWSKKRLLYRKEILFKYYVKNNNLIIKEKEKN